MSAAQLTATAVRVLREAVAHGTYGHSSGLFRPTTAGKRGPGKWRRAGGQVHGHQPRLPAPAANTVARAYKELEAAGLVTVTRQTQHEYAFCGTEYVCRPTAAAAAALAALETTTP